MGVKPGIATGKPMWKIPMREGGREGGGREERGERRRDGLELPHYPSARHLGMNPKDSSSHHRDASIHIYSSKGAATCVSTEEHTLKMQTDTLQFCSAIRKKRIHRKMDTSRKQAM